MKIQVKQGSVAGESTEVLVLAGYEDESSLGQSGEMLDRSLGGYLRELRKTKEFRGKNHETVLIHTRGAIPPKRILFVGLGEKADVTVDRVRQAMGIVAKRVRQAGLSSFTTSIIGTNMPQASPTALTQAMIEGALLGTYRFSYYRTEKNDERKGLTQITLVTPKHTHVDAIKRGARYGEASAEATAFARDLSNHPSNVMTPTRVVQEAKTIAKEPGVRLKVLEQKDQEKLGMGGLLGVARGSHEPPKFIILEYTGSGRQRKTDRPIVLVGKTVTFDTGGISLKPADSMEQMKADMTGGAEVLATIRAIARLRLPVHVIGILPVTENMPGGRAIKPGDILTMLSGKTVEVQNTDAEGRLILADGLSYGAGLKPACLIDIATLTGACAVALGQFAIGMLGNNDVLKKQLQHAGMQAGERVWEMPLWDEYFEQLKSDVADMRNIGGRGGGMITAAIFLSKFVGNIPWVHLDIASTDWSQTERPYIGKGPTAIGTRLLLQFFLNHVNDAK
ncbi:MAG: leucyl aminopeptidase [Nitrospirales bacterium]|nr:leucyl aminopeptidase [Nitrospirales bacterium]